MSLSPKPGKSSAIARLCPACWRVGVAANAIETVKQFGYKLIDHLVSPTTNAAIAEYFGEAPGNRLACQETTDPEHCTKTYKLARARVLMARSEATGVDAADDDAAVLVTMKGESGPTVDVEVSTVAAYAQERWTAGALIAETGAHNARGEFELDADIVALQEVIGAGPAGAGRASARASGER